MENNNWSIGCSMDLNDDSDNSLKSLIGLINEPTKFYVNLGHKIYIKGKQYARPFTYIHYTDLGKATLDFAEKTPFDKDELHKFRVKLEGFGSPVD